MSKVKMNQRDYELELVRMEFVDGVSEIARDAWKSQWPIVFSVETGPMSELQKDNYYKSIIDIALLAQRWWIDKQTEFVSKLIDNYKTNLFFRQIAEQNKKDLDIINEKLKDAEKMKNFLIELKKNKPHNQSISGNKLDNKFQVLHDLLNRVFRDYKDNAYVAGDEYISSLPFQFKVGLLDDLLTAYLSGHYARNEKIDDKYLSKYQYNMSLSYFSFLPMNFESGADINPQLDLTYFIPYFECYCNFITKLLEIDIDIETDHRSKKGGSKSTRKHRKKITIRQNGITPF